MKKIAYIDMDGTLANKVDKGSLSIPIESTSIKRNKRYKPNEIVTNVFGPSFLLRDKLRFLKIVKNAGVELVIVTSRDSVSALNISDKVLNLFSRIYYGAGLKCFVIGKGDDEEYNMKQSRYLPTIHKKAKFVKKCLEDLSVTYAICGVDEPIWYVQVQNMDIHSTEFLKYIYALEQEGILVSILHSNIIELNLCQISKLEAVTYDLERVAKEEGADSRIYSACMGDSLIDYEMLEACTIGVFPDSLIQKAAGSASHTNTSNINKVTNVADNLWMDKNVRILGGLFSKTNKHSIEDFEARL